MCAPNLSNEEGGTFMRKLLLLLLPAVILGCGGKSYLTYKGLPAAPSLDGKVAIEVRDGREPNGRTAEHDVVGAQTRVLVPAPLPIKLDQPETVPGTLARLFSDAARAAGIGVVAPTATDATGKLIVEVYRFWCSGYDPVYKVDISVNLIVADPSGAQVRVPGQPLSITGSSTRCHGAYEKSLTQLLNVAKTVLAGDPVKKAVISNP
jgi:hypothetical protein